MSNDKPNGKGLITGITTDLGYVGTDKEPPTQEEAEAAIAQAVEESYGIPPGAIDIQDGEWCLWQPRKIGNDKLFPCYAAVVNSTGMVLLFAAAGPAGVYKRVDDFRNPNLRDIPNPLDNEL